MEIYRDKLVYIEVEAAEIPWLKVFTIKKEKEFTDCDSQTRRHIFDLLEVIEKEMLAYYQPAKINIASFANYLPRVHWHIMSRYKEDSFYPETVWGVRQREAKLDLPSMEGFVKQLLPKLAVLENGA